MDIIERKHAAAADLPTYYTGKYCKNGHLTYRYTKSGSCQECINGVKTIDLRAGTVRESEITIRSDAKQSQIEKAKQAQAEADRRRLEALAAQDAAKHKETATKSALRDMVTLPVAVFDSCWIGFRDGVICIARQTLPELDDTAIVSDDAREKTLGNGVGNYNVKVFREDADDIVKWAATLYTNELERLSDLDFATTPGALKQADVDRLKKFHYAHRKDNLTQLGEYLYSTDDLEELRDGGLFRFVKPRATADTHIAIPLTRETLLKEIGWNGTTADDWLELEHNEAIGDLCGATQILGDWYRDDHIVASVRGRMLTIAPIDIEDNDSRK